MNTIIKLDLEFFYWLVDRTFRWFEYLMRQINPKHSENRGRETISLDFLLKVASLALPAKHREAMLGDMAEQFDLDSARFGKRWAKLLLAKDIGLSIYPVVKGVLQSKLLKILKAVGLQIIIKYFIS